MNVNIEDLGATRKKMTVELPADKVAQEFEKTLDLLRRQARLKGFRPGKAPASIIRRMFAAHIEQEVTKGLMEEALPDALEQVAETLVSQPALEESTFKEGEPYRFTVSFEVLPVFEVDGYKGLALTREKVNVTDEDVNKKLEDLRQAYATTQSLEEERPVAEQDFAVIDYTAFDGQEPIEGAANPNFQLEVGAGNFNEAFEKELVGMTKQEKKEISVDFPEGHYNPKLAGNHVRFEVTLLDIKEKVIPELNDEFAQDLDPELESVDQLREKLMSDMTAGENRRVDGLVRQQVREKLLELVEPEVPESMIGRETEGMISSTAFNLKRSGLSLEAMGMSEVQLRDNYRPEAEKRVRTALILDRIAKREELEATQEDLDGSLLEISRETGQPLEMISEYYKNSNMLDSLRESTLTEKTLKFIIDSATIEIIDPPVEAAENDPEAAPVEASEQD